VTDIQKRSAVRHRTFLHAHITCAGQAYSADCSVNQLSDVGAQLSIAASIALSDHFDITIPQKRMSHRARLVWRSANHAGVEFLAAAAAPMEDLDHQLIALEAENARLKAQLGELLLRVARLTDA
jgi:PilZ domain